MIKGDPKSVFHDALRFTNHVAAWFHWQTSPPAEPTGDAARHEAKAREMLARINAAFGLASRPALTWQEWQFVGWIVDELAKRNPSWPRSLCIQQAIDAYDYFLDTEGTLFGDNDYDWSEDAAACFALDIGMAE